MNQHIIVLPSYESVSALSSEMDKWANNVYRGNTTIDENIATLNMYAQKAAALLPATEPILKEYEFVSKKEKDAQCFEYGSSLYTAISSIEKNGLTAKAGAFINDMREQADRINACGVILRMQSDIEYFRSLMAEKV